MINTAWLSSDRVYRYALTRAWLGGSGYVAFVGLNPSTADESENDPTIRRCMRFAKDWGYAGLLMVNLFAYRATKPEDMMAATGPVGGRNDAWLTAVDSASAMVVAAWGAKGGFMGRDKQVRALIPNMKCLRLTKDGHPGHPLYLPASCTPIEFPA